MQRPTEDFDDPIRTVGEDSTSTFDDTASNPTEHASSEALSSATDVDDEADPISGSDDAIEPVGLDAADADDDVDIDLDDADLDDADLDEEAPIDGEYLSNPAASTGSTTDVDADALEDEDDELEDDDEDEDLEDDDDADLEDDDVEDDAETADEDDDLEDDDDADLEDDASPQASVGTTKQ